MTQSALFPLVLLALAATVLAQPDPADPTPLYSKHYAYPNGIPYQVDYNTAAIRGPQLGYNICNSTTENQDSMCQTSFVNHLDDFCLWGPPKPGSSIGESEGGQVAWCTLHGHGTRVIPAGALTGVQLIRTPDYVQIVGFINQTQINILAGDEGGELDPHGADLRGNPIGGLMYSNAFPRTNADNDTYLQIYDWTNFMGGNFFCIKVCDPAGKTPGAYCQNIYDLLGCGYNAPNNARNGVFESCEGDNMTPPGLYPGPNGQTMTYFQPAESLGAIPYVPVVPKSSNCVTYQSTDLYTPHPTPKHTRSAMTTAKPTSSPTHPLTHAAATTSNDASVIAISSVATIAGALFAMVFLS